MAPPHQRGRDLGDHEIVVGGIYRLRHKEEVNESASSMYGINREMLGHLVLIIRPSPLRLGGEHSYTVLEVGIMSKGKVCRSADLDLRPTS